MIKYDVPLDLENNDNMKELVKQIKPNSLVLEFGPSTGRLTSYLKNELNCQVYIVEIDRDAYEISKQYSEKAICDDIESYSWKEMVDGVTFDYVIFADVLEHLRNPEQVITELKHYIDKNSKILVSVPNITHNAVILQLLNQRFDYQKTGLLDNTHIHFFTKETIKEMFLRSGYHMISCKGTFAEPYNTELEMNFEGLPQSVIDYLSSRDYGNLYQVLCEFSLNETLETNGEIVKDESRQYFAKIFIDYNGEGFCEENSSYHKIDLNDGIINVSVDYGDDEKFIHSMALSPLDNYWSESSIKEVKINDSRILTDYVIDNSCIVNEENNSIIKEQKYVFGIHQNVKKLSVCYQCKKILIDEVYKYTYKAYLDLNHTYKVLKNKYMPNGTQFLGYDRKRISLIEELCKEKVQQKAALMNNSRISRIFNKRKATMYEIKSYNFHAYNPFTYYKHNFIFSAVEDPLALLTSDYAIISFLKNDLPVEFYDYISCLRLDNLVYYFDSTVKDKANYKTDFSIDYVLNNACEFDVLVVSSDLLKMVLEDYSLELFNNSRELMLILSKYTKDIKHIPEILYNTDEGKANTLSKSIVTDVLEYRYFGHASYDNERVDFDYLDNKPKISIIIPTKDGLSMLSGCVESIIEKTVYPNYEVIILNNNSEKEETFVWFEQIVNKYSHVKVIDALFEFNWSKLNNYGIKHATGDVYIFLNNDTVVKSNEWIEVLAENALRPDVGVVGALLLYEDETIQHAGVVIGMTDFADHIYKAESLECDLTYFPGPLQKRNVLAVTGACMAISKTVIEKIGGFDEEFIICGSDVEICLRAYKLGLVNVYEPNAVLYHLESKTRDSYIPEIDFYLSSIHYEPFKTHGDPFYNKNLNYKKTTPTVK